MAETGIITLDAAGEISYQFEEDFVPVEIVDSTDETRTPLSVLVSEVNRLQQQVAALTQKSKKWDSVCSRVSIDTTHVERFCVRWANAQEGRPILSTDIDGKTCKIAILSDGILVAVDDEELGVARWA